MNARTVSLSTLVWVLALAPGCGGEASPGDDASPGTDTGASGDGSGGDSAGTDGSSAGSDGGTGDGSSSHGDSTGGLSTGGGESDGSTGSDGTSGGSTGDGSTGGVMDETPPHVFALSPANGQSGVAKDTTIEITFTEPMDQASVEAAYDSNISGISPAKVTFSWNPEGTVLTVDPNADLNYAEGGPATAPIVYSYSIATSALDLAGNPLDQQLDATFETSRRITESLHSLPSLSGTLVSDGMNESIDASHCYVGDNADNDWMICGITFDLGELSGIVQEIEDVDVQFYLAGSGHQGEPLADLGALELWNAAFGSLLDLPPGMFVNPADNLAVLYDAYAPIDASVDVTDEVLADHQDPNAEGLTQFRLEIEGPWANTDDLVDYWKLQLANFPTLTVEYLAK